MANPDGTYYALRYLAGTPLAKRKHTPTLGRWDDYGDAVDALATRPGASLLEVVQRGDA